VSLDRRKHNCTKLVAGTAHRDSVHTIKSERMSEKYQRELIETLIQRS